MVSFNTKQKKSIFKRANLFSNNDTCIFIARVYSGDTPSGECYRLRMPRPLKKTNMEIISTKLYYLCRYKC